MALNTAADGGTRLTLRLHPAELGSVQIRIDRPADTPVQVSVTVDRPETLNLLVHDQSQLHHALDQAGVPANGRVLQFSLAGGGQNGAGSQSGFQAGAQQSGNPQSFASGATLPTGEDDDLAATPLPLPARFLRAGLDITA